MESVSPRTRSHMCNLVELFWVLGTASLSLIAYYLRQWWQVELFISVPSIIVPIISIW